MEKNIKDFAIKSEPKMFEDLITLCKIPAPSHFEQKRAEYCKRWLENIGATGVYIDEALNTVFPLNCENSNEIIVFAAHTDTVFPDMEPMEYYDDGEKIHGPGVSDDTASVIVLLNMAKFFLENKLLPQKGIMFVCNSCEEGLGNLKGTKQLFKDYEGRISKFITFDSSLNNIYNRCVGSHRYEVTVETEGGHSFGAFGNDNAIEKLSEIVTEIYKIEVPLKEGAKTTYNVGTISGGTSINTIAQSATMLCEYRSDDKECLDIMEAKFMKIFESARTRKIKLNVVKVGDRPCSSIEIDKLDVFENEVVPVIESVIGEKVTKHSGSTDCNVPLSLGVPALAVGTNNHAGVHTREEWLEKKSMIPGLEIAIKLGIALTK